MKAILFSYLLILISSTNLRNNAAWDFTTFYNDLMKQYNALRNKQKAAGLTKLDDIAKMAQKTADSCAKLGKLKHTIDYYKNQPVGQNLYMSTGAPSAANVLKDGIMKKNLIMIMIQENQKMVK